VFGTAPARRRGPVRAPGLTCGFWWQVQDSNLGRLSSAILQTRRENTVTCGASPSRYPVGTPWERAGRSSFIA
jgi:hypothetical protein